MAVRALRVFGGIAMIPVADDTYSKDKQRDERQRNPDDANCLRHCHCSGLFLVTNLLNTTSMSDVRKALPVTPTRVVTAGRVRFRVSGLGGLVEVSFEDGQA